MSLYALGLNHQTAPLAIRERVVFHVERLREALTELRRTLAHEAAILSTCTAPSFTLLAKSRRRLLSGSPATTASSRTGCGLISTRCRASRRSATCSVLHRASIRW